MSGSASFEAYGILAGFGMGIVIGVIAAVAVAIRREEKRWSLSGAAPGPLAGGVRWLTRFGSAGTHHRPRSHYRSRSRVR
jgi:hypothetical protein